MSLALEFVLGLSALTAAGTLLWAKRRLVRLQEGLMPDIHALVRASARMDEASVEARHAARVLATNVEVTKMLAQQDRDQLARLVRLLDRLDDKVSAGNIAAEEVAHDLAASHARADAAGGPHGAAADAAMKSSCD